ncbi:MacS family sensor histidine kinase [Nocardioides sp.]|uniref:MacS family sensor histidine kinase n=1 Tax=Nocardioides sp. TaxID=35761 RepID=UPI0039C987CA
MLVLVNAIGLNIYRADNFQHPRAGAVVVAVMAAWTVFAVWAYSDHRRRVPALLLADLAVALATILASPLVKGEELRATIPGFWVMGALLAWAIHWRWLGGLVAGLLLAAADLGVRQQVDQGNYGNVFLLVIGGPVVGFMCGVLQQLASDREVAERAAAAAAERDRLARAVHDGVLQVLALMQRRGRELGGEAEELGRLAGEQESALRSLIRQQDTLAGGGTEATQDLAGALAALEREHPVRVSTPAEPVLLAGARTTEVVAAVRECLSNVARHVGPDAPAWVLLEAFDDRVEVSVRDEGGGIPAGRLDEAASAGRLGVAQSIRGRIVDLGGTASVSTGSFGTEWELVVPR